MSENLRDAALEYHRTPTFGKISVVPTKPMVTQRDLSLAYSPGVADACNEIVRDPGEAHTLTARGNLVAVVTNGTAVLGLGNIGPLASKPVMEGKAVAYSRSSPASMCSTSRLNGEARWTSLGRDHCPRSSPRSAASTSRTSRRPSASMIERKPEASG
jgi:hypothetical protein